MNKFPQICSISWLNARICGVGSNAQIFANPPIAAKKITALLIINKQTIMNSQNQQSPKMYGKTREQS